jgi:hypothetical protein
MSNGFRIVENFRHAARFVLGVETRRPSGQARVDRPIPAAAHADAVCKPSTDPGTNATIVGEAAARNYRHHS